MTERELCSKCHGNGVIRLPNGVEECSRCHGDCWEPDAPPPPAAADRGVPGQKISDARLAEIQGRMWLDEELALMSCDLVACRAALATAPKAEDVRREVIEQVEYWLKNNCDYEHAEGVRKAIALFREFSQ